MSIQNGDSWVIKLRKNIPYVLFKKVEKYILIFRVIFYPNSLKCLKW